MYSDNAMTLAKQNLAERVGVKAKSLEFAFLWQFAGKIYFSFQINQPDHAQNGSTLSVNVSDLKQI